MITNYLIYLINLPTKEKTQQILILLAFFLVLFFICGLLAFLKAKFLNKKKNSLLQKFLEKI